jgi:hypothetical protein
MTHTRFLRWRIIRALGWADRNRLLQLQNEEGFELMIIGADVTIRDARGASMVPQDLPLGCEVEYAGRYGEGLNVARFLRVTSTPLAGDA